MLKIFRKKLKPLNNPIVLSMNISMILDKKKYKKLSILPWRSKHELIYFYNACNFSISLYLYFYNP